MGKLYSAGKRKQCLSCVRQSFYGKKAITAHETEEDARKRTMSALEAYANLIENTLAIPFIVVKKHHLTFCGCCGIPIQSKR